MSIKIMLDAGHYGKYNRSPAVKEYYESIMNWKLHLLLKKYLEEYGFEVGSTRKEQTKNLEVTRRGKKSKGYRLLVSIHSNATGKVNEKVDAPIAYVQLNGSGRALGKQLSECVARVMSTMQAGKVATRKGQNGDYYGILRGAASVGTPAILLEHSYHTNTRATNFLLDEGNLEKLARAEAAVIAEYYGVRSIDPTKDGVLDIQDVTALIDHLSGGLEYKTEMDVNGDGENDIRDVSALQDALVNADKKEQEEEKTVMIELKQIRKGSKSAEVKTVQRLLNALGYKGKSGKELVVDGDFGGNTDDAVRAFQKDSQLDVDGIVGEKSWTVLLKGG